MCMSWRGAHAWLRGYSDALEGKSLALPPTFEASCEDAYEHGYSAGARHGEAIIV